jgi:hypothetical protein
VSGKDYESEANSIERDENRERIPQGRSRRWWAVRDDEDPFRSQQNDCCKPRRDQVGKQMRHLFPAGTLMMEDEVFVAT